LSGTLDTGILQSAQLSGNTYKATAIAGTSAATVSLTSAGNFAAYSFSTLLPLTQYKIDIYRETSSGSKVTIASTTGTSGVALSKGRAASKSKSVEVNMFSTYAAKVYAKQLSASGNETEALKLALNDLFPASISANVEHLEDVTVKKGVATRVDSTGNTITLPIRAKASAKIKLITQVAKSATYLPETALHSQAAQLEELAENVAHETSMGNISAHYKKPTFLGMIKEVKASGANIKKMMKEADPVLANMDMINHLHTFDFDSHTIDENFEVDTHFGHVFSSDNLAKQMHAYEMAMESYIKDVPGMSYDSPSHEFFDDFDHEFEDFNAQAWVKESMNEIADIFDDFEHDDTSFTFSFDTSDLTDMFSDTFKEMANLEGHADSFGSDDFAGVFKELDFTALSSDFADHSISIGDIYDEHELDDFFGDAQGLQLFHFNLAHPTYGRQRVRNINGNNFFDITVGSLAPVFRVEFLPTPELEALADEDLDELFDLTFTTSEGETIVANSDNLFFSTLRHDLDKNVMYLAFHKSSDLGITDGELEPGESYSFVITPTQNLTLADGTSANVIFVDGSTTYEGNLNVKPITFTVPFDAQNLNTQVDLFGHEGDFFEDFIQGADVDEHFVDVQPSVFQESGQSGSVRTATALSINPSLVSQSGVYEVLVKNGPMLTWNMGGNASSIEPAKAYFGFQFFDVDKDGFTEDLEVIGSSTGAKAEVLDAAPTILVHSAYGINVNDSATDLGLFDQGKLSVMAINHWAERPEPEVVGPEYFVGVWDSAEDDGRTLTITENFTWTTTGGSDPTESGVWDFIADSLLISDNGLDFREADYEFKEDGDIMVITEESGEVSVWIISDSSITTDDLEGLGIDLDALQSFAGDIDNMTYFSTWFEDENDDSTTSANVGVVESISFSNGQLSIQGITNSSYTFTAAYGVDDKGVISFEESGNIITLEVIDGDNEDYALVQITEDDGDTYVDRWYYDIDDANDFSRALTEAMGDTMKADEIFMEMMAFDEIVDMFKGDWYNTEMDDGVRADGTSDNTQTEVSGYGTIMVEKGMWTFDFDNDPSQVHSDNIEVGMDGMSISYLDDDGMGRSIFTYDPSTENVTWEWQKFDSASGNFLEDYETGLLTPVQPMSSFSDATDGRNLYVAWYEDDADGSEIPDNGGVVEIGNLVGGNLIISGFKNSNYSLDVPYELSANGILSFVESGNTTSLAVIDASDDEYALVEIIEGDETFNERFYYSYDNALDFAEALTETSGNVTKADEMLD
jgi:hypothetical protein